MIRCLLAAVILNALLAGPVRAEPRIALVVGNADYRSVGALDNAVNDARLIAAKLTEIGFEVIYVADAELFQFKKAISAFGRRLREAGPAATGLFYYAGHGVQSFGSNYLLPVDTALTDAADLPLVSVEADSVLRQMHSARNRTNIVILDACRNNPFVGVPNFTDGGLAEMSAPTGSFVAFATAPGDIAYDGGGRNSPYTSALAALLKTPGLAIEQLFKQVRIKVLETTDGRQTPWDTSSLTGDFAFVAARPAPAGDTEADLWNTVRTGRDPVQIELFLRAYPAGRFATAARALLREVQAARPAAPAAPQAKAPDQAEIKLIERARLEGSLEAYRAYLDAYPNGVFAALAQSEMAALDKGTERDPNGEGLVPVTPDQDQDPSPPVSGVRVTFLGPISDPGSVVDGRSLVDLIAASPIFPPFDGLPDQVWKNKDCAECHQWDREKLCEQAKTYIGRIRGLERIQHPFGGAFKRALVNWAQGDCPDR